MPNYIVISKAYFSDKKPKVDKQGIILHQNGPYKHSGVSTVTAFERLRDPVLLFCGLMRAGLLTFDYLKKIIIQQHDIWEEIAALHNETPHRKKPSRIYLPYLWDIDKLLRAIGQKDDLDALFSCNVGVYPVVFYADGIFSKYNKLSWAVEGGNYSPIMEQFLYPENIVEVLPILDYDIDDYQEVLKDLENIQSKFDLGPALINRTDRGFHAWFVEDSVSWDKIRRIFDESSKVCSGYVNSFLKMRSCIRITSKNRAVPIPTHVWEQRMQLHPKPDIFMHSMLMPDGTIIPCLSDNGKRLFREVSVAKGPRFRVYGYHPVLAHNMRIRSAYNRKEVPYPPYLTTNSKRELENELAGRVQWSLRKRSSKADLDGLIKGTPPIRMTPLARSLFWLMLAQDRLRVLAAKTIVKTAADHGFGRVILEEKEEVSGPCGDLVNIYRWLSSFSIAAYFGYRSLLNEAAREKTKTREVNT